MSTNAASVEILDGFHRGPSPSETVPSPSETVPSPSETVPSPSETVS